MAYKVDVVGGQTKYLPNVKTPDSEEREVYSWRARRSRLEDDEHQRLDDLERISKAYDAEVFEISGVDLARLEADQEQLARIAAKIESIVVEAPHLLGIDVDVAVGQLVYSWRSRHWNNVEVEVERGREVEQLRGDLERISKAYEAEVRSRVDLVSSHEREVAQLRLDLDIVVRSRLDLVSLHGREVAQLRRELDAALEQIGRMRGKDLRRPSETPTVQASAPNLPDISAINSSTEMLVGAMQEFIRQIRSEPPEAHRASAAEPISGNGKISP